VSLALAKARLGGHAERNAYYTLAAK